MRILINGCWRSGTTAAFNLTRLICEWHGRTYGVFEDDYREEVGTEYDFEIVKVHKFKAKWVEWADVIITIFREPEEVMGSMQRFTSSNGRQYGIADLLRGLAYWGHYQQYTSYLINYAQIERCPEKLAEQIAMRIGLKVRPKEIVKQFEAIKPPSEGYDPVTLLHANHITR